MWQWALGDLLVRRRGRDRQVAEAGHAGARHEYATSGSQSRQDYAGNAGHRPSERLLFVVSRLGKKRLQRNEGLGFLYVKADARQGSAPRSRPAAPVRDCVVERSTMVNEQLLERTGTQMARVSIDCGEQSVEERQYLRRPSRAAFSTTSQAQPCSPNSARSRSARSPVARR